MAHAEKKKFVLVHVYELTEKQAEAFNAAKERGVGSVPSGEHLPHLVPADHIPGIENEGDDAEDVDVNEGDNEGDDDDGEVLSTQDDTEPVAAPIGAEGSTPPESGDTSSDSPDANPQSVAPQSRSRHTRAKSDDPIADRLEEMNAGA